MAGAPGQEDGREADQATNETKENMQEIKLPGGGVSHDLHPMAGSFQSGGLAQLQYVEHQGDCRVRQFGISTGCGDYWLHLMSQDICSVSGKERFQNVDFRFCISGGFERNYPKTTAAIANLYRAMRDDMERLDKEA